jgi:modulator of FtsH protease
MGFSYAPTAAVQTGAERATLVKRTYGLVFLSILVTMGGVAFAFTQEALLNSVARHPFIGILCVFAPLIMAQRSAREFPKNIILTFIFALVEGIYIAPFLYMAERSAPGVITQAGALTFAAFGVLTLYATLSRRDFSAWGGFLIVGVFVLIAASILNMFIGGAAGALWISAIGVMIFAGLLVFDTWRIVRSGTYTQDDYVLATVAIYLDLLNMFMFLVSLLGNGNRRR